MRPTDSPGIPEATNRGGLTMQPSLRPVLYRVTLVTLLGLLRLWSWPAAANAQATAEKPAAKALNTSPERWEKDIRAFEKADRTSPQPRGAILFIGASSVRRWSTLAQDFPEYTVINRGF